MIPASIISPISQKIVALYQQYYKPLAAGLINNDVATQINNPWFHQTQLSFKLDHNISNKDHLAGSFIWTERPRILADTGNGVLGCE